MWTPPFYASFAQQGIALQEFQKAYSDAYERGRSDMLSHRFSFFYAATAIAYHDMIAAAVSTRSSPEPTTSSPDDGTAEKEKEAVPLTTLDN